MNKPADILTDTPTDVPADTTHAEATGSTPPSLSLLPIMFAVFSGTMGLMAFVAIAGPLARTLALEPWHIGTALTAGGLTWVVCARWWGGYSDKVGRRPVLLRGVGGFTLSYAALCVFIDVSLSTLLSATLVFIGLALLRGLVGAFYAAVPATSSALIADHIEPKKRASAMAAIGSASGAGMVIGPGFVGLLAPLSLTVPLYITAILPAIAWLVLWRTLPTTPPQNIRPSTPLRFSDIRLRRPMTIAFCAAFSVAIAQTTVGFLALDALDLEPNAAARVAGIALTLVGVALIISQTILRKLQWSPQRLIRYGSLVAAVGFGTTALAQSSWMIWVCFAVAASGMGWIYPSLSALAANSVNPGEQGVAAGTVASVQGAGVISGPIIGTLLYEVGIGLPYLLVSVLLFFGGLYAAGHVTATDTE